MPDRDSVTHWLRALKEGEQDAAQRLWERYFQRLVRLAARSLRGRTCRVFDEEDVALSAFQSFCERFQGDRFPQLADRDNLWAVLVVLTARKAQAHLRHQNRLKRGGGRVQGETDLRPDGAEAGGVGLDMLLGPGPSPAFAAQAAEECERLLDGLGDENLRAVALLKLQAYTVAEIAEQVGSTRRSVERRLQIIRKTWSREIALAEEGL